MNVKPLLSAIVLSASIAGSAESAQACTSMLVSASASATGRPLMWKHRDTGTEHNFVERVEATDTHPGYVALYNGGDSLLAEAWMGMNDYGFAIMNTASYNLAPDTAKIKDREGLVMSAALKKCATVDDFAALLDTLPKPMGVQANFGVMDRQGNLAYFETDDYRFTRYDVDDSTGYLLRTNHSMSGAEGKGYGYVRYDNALHILGDEIAGRRLSPEAFTEKASRSFWHSLLRRDAEADGARWVIDQDYIPRNISTASIVIEGMTDSHDDMLMWTTIGYPPCGDVRLVTLSHVPDELRPLAPGWHSALCDEVVGRKRKAFPLKAGNGKHYIDMDYVRAQNVERRAVSLDTYSRQRELLNSK